MHIPFQDATALPTKLTKNPAYRKGKQSIPTISTSAARDREGRLWLALVNTHPQQPQTLTLDNKTFSEVQGQVLTADSMEAQNIFTQPQVVKPVAFSAKRENGKLTIDLPAKSVTVVQIL
jgi:alpha-N-arabinofuranosidase